jgi:DNA-binding phage protein
MAGFTYKSYNFVDKDPIIDEVRGVFQQTGVTHKWVADRSGVTTQTMNKWFSGKTRKPQAATVNAVLRAMGYKLGVVPYEEGTWAEEPPDSVRHVVQMAKYGRKKWVAGRKAS